MTLSKLGPHGIKTTPEGLAWASVAPVVKQMDGTGLLRAAPDASVRIFRHFFPTQSLDADPRAAGSAILNALDGYRHPKLYVEVYVGVPGADHARHIAFLNAVVPYLHAAGVKVCGPSWYTGDYEADAWAAFRALKWVGLDLIAVQAYWSTAGFTKWNATRWQQFWKPGDPRVVVTECGRDQVRDGPNGTLLPHGGPGAYGWAAQGVDGAAFVRELEAYDALLVADAAVVGGTPFTVGPTDDWAAKGFGLDVLARDLAQRTTRPKEAPVALRGCDLSNWQGPAVDFHAIAGSGRSFVLIKASEDPGFLDPDFALDWRSAEAAGLIRGAYHFAQPDNSSPQSSVALLKRALDAAGGLAPGDLVALDLEASSGDLSDWAIAWLAEAEAVFGVRPFLYSGEWFMGPHNLDGHADTLGRYPLWLASYQDTLPPVPNGWQGLTIWQDSAKGSVPGVPGDCDTDQFLGTIEQLRALGLQAPKEDDVPLLTVDKAQYEVAYWAPLYRRQQEDAAMVTALRATGHHADALLADAIEKAAGVLQPTASLHKIVCGAEAA